MLQRILIRSLVAASILASSGAAFAQTLQFHPVTPCRLIDTRQVGNAGCVSDGSGGCLPMSSDTYRTFVVRGQCGVPASGAQAIAFNLTAFNSTNLGRLAIMPYSASQPSGGPSVSTVNFQLGQNTPNGGIVSLAAEGSAADGMVYAFVAGAGNVGYVLDITGYFQP